MKTTTRFALYSSWSCYPTWASQHQWPHDCRREVLPEQQVSAVCCRHSAHHVPVKLLFCEPEGQCTPPATGHCSNTMWIYWTWGETHQSTAAGFYSSLGTFEKEGKAGLICHQIKWPKVEKWLTVTVLASLLVKNSSPPSKLSLRYRMALWEKKAAIQF